LNVRWPSECQVLNERIRHIRSLPSSPEIFYENTGKENPFLRLKGLHASILRLKGLHERILRLKGLYELILRLKGLY